MSKGKSYGHTLDFNNSSSDDDLEPYIPLSTLSSKKLSSAKSDKKTEDVILLLSSSEDEDELKTAPFHDRKVARKKCIMMESHNFEPMSKLCYYFFNATRDLM